MRTLIAATAALVSALAITCSMAASGGQQTTSGGRAEDEAAIRKIVTRLQEGWNAGDGKAFAAPFAEDADYVIVNGMRVKGRAVIDSGHQQIFDTIYKNSHNTATVQSVRFIRGDVAVAHVEWHLKYNAGGAAREGRSINSLVLTKDNGQWSIVAFQLTPIAPAQR